MKKADPASLIILAAVMAAAMAGTIGLKRSLARDRVAQQGAYAAPASQGAITFAGADSLPALARNVCDTHLWFNAVFPDFTRFGQVLDGNDLEDVDQSLFYLGQQHAPDVEELPQMTYCRIFNTEAMDCSRVFDALASNMADRKYDLETLQDTADQLNVQGCGVARGTLVYTMRGKSKTFHHFVAGIIDDQWRVLLLVSQ